jgi:predicted nucleic acid-binding protein
MPNSGEDISVYPFGPTDELFLDANVWMLVHGPQTPGDPKVAIYSGALARILGAQSRIHIDVLILPEFINTYARLRFHILYPKSAARPNFKQFRNSAAFEPIAKDIADAVRRVLKNCVRTESLFSTVDIDALVNEYEKGNSDFNDQVFTEICRTKGWKLVTDDSDFKGCGVSLVTANRTLLP